MSKGVIVTIVVLLSLVGMGFFQYKQLESGATTGTGSPLSALSTAFSASLSSSDADTAEINELLALLGQVSVLDRFDSDLFDRPDYLILKDFSVTLFPAKTVGRKNPFLGIDEGIVVPKPASTTSSNSSAIGTKTQQSSQVDQSTINSSSSSAQNDTSLSIDSLIKEATQSIGTGGEVDPLLFINQAPTQNDAQNTVIQEPATFNQSTLGDKICKSTLTQADIDTGIAAGVDYLQIVDDSC